VFFRRERFIGLGHDLASASPASIDARMAGRFVGPVLPVEFRTDADFYVIAAPEQRHESSSFADHSGPDYEERRKTADASLASLRQ
jgi:hypothetical protein